MIFQFAFSEIKRNIRSCLLSLIVLTGVFLVALSVLSVALGIKESFDNSVQKANPRGLSFDLVGTVDLEKANACGADEITARVPFVTADTAFIDDQGELFSTWQTVTEGEETTLYSYNGESYFFEEHLPASFAAADGLLSGRWWKGGDNSPESRLIWLSDFFSEQLGFGAGDEVVMKLKSGQEVRFTVMGVYSLAAYEEVGVTVPYFILSASAAQEVGQGGQVSAWVSDSKKASDCYFRFKRLGYVESDDNVLYKMFEGVGMTAGMFSALAAVFFVLGAGVLWGVVSMLISERESHIGLMMTLGMRERRMVGVYLVLFATLIAAAVLLAALFALPLNAYFSAVATNLLGYTAVIRLTWYAPLILVGLSALVLPLAAYGLRRRIAGMQFSGVGGRNE